jgi:hypothetical protein
VGFTPQDDADLGHLALLIPCEADDQECEDTENASVRETSAHAPILRSPTINKESPRRVLTPSENLAAWRARLANRYHIPFGGQTLSHAPATSDKDDGPDCAQLGQTPATSASACQCRGCGRYSFRIRPAYQRDTPILEAIAPTEISASRRLNLLGRVSHTIGLPHPIAGCPIQSLFCAIEWGHDAVDVPSSLKQVILSFRPD